MFEPLTFNCIFKIKAMTVTALGDPKFSTVIVLRLCAKSKSTLLYITFNIIKISHDAEKGFLSNYCLQMH